jgi:copper chaperone CopZ
MKRLTGVLLVALCMLGLSCRTKDVREVFILIPEMKNVACADVVVRAANAVQGVHPDKTRIEMEKRAVIVTYDSLITGLKNIEFAIADAGFQANEVPANKAAAAALPAACR